MASTPQFTSTPKVETIVLSVANANLDGSGTLGVGSFTAGSNGSMIEKVSLNAKETTTQGMVRLFLYNGADYAFVGEIPVSAKTPSDTATSFSLVVDKSVNPIFPMVIPTGTSLYASTGKAESMDLTMFGGDY